LQSDVLVVARGTQLHYKPLVSGGAFISPFELATQINRATHPLGSAYGNQTGTNNEHGFSVSRIHGSTPGVAAPAIALVDALADPGEVLGEALVFSPAPDGVQRRFTATLANKNLVPSQTKITLSNGDTFIDDGAGLLRFNGIKSQGFIEYNLEPLEGAAVLVFEFPEAPPVGLTGTVDYWFGQTPAETALGAGVGASLLFPAVSDSYVLEVPLGSYLKVGTALDTLTGAGYISVRMGAYLRPSAGSSVYNFVG